MRIFYLGKFSLAEKKKNDIIKTGIITVFIKRRIRIWQN